MNAFRRWIAGGSALLLFGLGVIAAAWFAALAVDLATRAMMRVLAPFGADLPGPTLLTMSAGRSYVPWIIAAASTLIIGLVWVKASRYFVHACAAVAGLIAVATAFATFSLALPLVKTCGDAPRGAPVSSCR